MQTPVDKEIILTLYSHPMKDVQQRWKARLTFKSASTDESDAILEIVDGEGAPITAGTFEFAGSSIAIKDGTGKLKCRDFVSGKHEKAIWLHRQGMPPVPGALTFE